MVFRTFKCDEGFAFYDHDKLLGVLIAKIYNEPKFHKSLIKKSYIKFIDFIQKVFFKESLNSYDLANQKMLNEYKLNHMPDGEIRFLETDPNALNKGVGTAFK